METTTQPLPPPAVMWKAFRASDARYDGLFLAGVTSTSIFCRPSCRARKPRRDRVRFFASAHDAAFAGFRPCKRCAPLRPPGGAPEWLAPLVRAVEREPEDEQAPSPASAD